MQQNQRKWLHKNGIASNLLIYRRKLQANVIKLQIVEDFKVVRLNQILVDCVLNY